MTSPHWYTEPHHLIKDNLIDLIQRTFSRENKQTFYLACNEERAFFTSGVYKNDKLWSCQKVCEPLVSLLDNRFIRFGTTYAISKCRPLYKSMQSKSADLPTCLSHTPFQSADLLTRPPLHMPFQSADLSTTVHSFK